MNFNLILLLNFKLCVFKSCVLNVCVAIKDVLLVSKPELWTVHVDCPPLVAAALLDVNRVHLSLCPRRAQYGSSPALEHSVW